MTKITDEKALRVVCKRADCWFCDLFDRDDGCKIQDENKRSPKDKNWRCEI